MEPNTIDLGWDAIQSSIEYLSVFLKEKQVKCITGMPRGGLIPAVMISHHSKIPFRSLESVDTLDYPREQIAIVDDISDSGITLQPFVAQGYTVVTLCHKVTCTIEVSKYMYKIEERDWVIFPWERKDAKQIADYLDK